MPILDDNSRVSDRVDSDLANYRAVSVGAVIGLLSSFAALTAFVHPILWILPLVAVGINLRALRVIAQHPAEYVGRRAAAAGLLLALAIGAAAPARYFAVQEGSRLSARRLAEEWFADVQDGKFAEAAELLRQPDLRRTAEDIETHYREDPQGRSAVHSVATMPVVQALEMLGDTVQLHYLSTEYQRSSSHTEWIRTLWRLDYERDGEPGSLLVRVAQERDVKGSAHAYDWQIKRVEFVDVPPAWLKFAPH